MLLWGNKVVNCNEKLMTEEKLDELGGDGWMLISVVPSQTYVAHCVYYFRRPIGVKDINSVSDESQKH